MQADAPTELWLTRVLFRCCPFHMVSALHHGCVSLAALHLPRKSKVSVLYAFPINVFDKIHLCHVYRHPSSVFWLGDLPHDWGWTHTWINHPAAKIQKTVMGNTISLYILNTGGDRKKAGMSLPKVPVSLQRSEFSSRKHMAPKSIR